MKMASGISYKNVAFISAKLATVGVLAYSLLIMAYALIRSSVTIFKMMPKDERQGILFLNSLSIAYAVVIFSLTMALVSSMGGALSGMILKKSLLVFNPLCNKKKAVLIGIIVFVMLLGMLYIIFYSALGPNLNHPEPLLFWFAFPAIFFCIACVKGSVLLNIILRNSL